MVKRTHQDFLPDLLPEENADASAIVYCDDDVSTVRSHLLPKDLFDTDGAYKRKVNISYLDAQISTRHDWDGLCKSVRHVDCLYLIDDRIVVNPIMEDFARMKTLQYIRQFSEDNIPVKIVRKANANTPNEMYRNTFHKQQNAAPWGRNLTTGGTTGGMRRRRSPPHPSRPTESSSDDSTSLLTRTTAFI